MHPNLLCNEIYNLAKNLLWIQKCNSSKKAFNNNLTALTIIDNATNYKWGFPLQNQVLLLLKN